MYEIGFINQRQMYPLDINFLHMLQLIVFLGLILFLLKNKKKSKIKKDINFGRVSIGPNPKEGERDSIHRGCTAQAAHA